MGRRPEPAKEQMNFKVSGKSRRALERIADYQAMGLGEALNWLIREKAQQLGYWEEKETVACQ